jgi:hypothetical protein
VTETEVLEHIRNEYGDLIRASVLKWNVRTEVLAGIMCRESAGGYALQPPGPAGVGDGGHGHGLMQIDDRSFPDFCASSLWQDPQSNIDFGAKVLAEKRTYMISHTVNLGDVVVERCAIAGYNCGAARVVQALKGGLDIDWFTTQRNYSKEVLRMADAYLVLSPSDPLSLTQEPSRQKQTLLQMLYSLFGRRKGIS